MLEIFIVGLAALIGVITQRVLGFGIAAFLTPATLFYFSPSATVVIGLTIGTLACVIILFDARKHIVFNFQVVSMLFLSSIPGSIVGAFVVTKIDKSMLQIVVGILVIAGILIQERVFPKPIKPLKASRGILMSGLTAGTLNAGAGNGVPPIILWLRTHKVTPEQVRQNFAAIFILMNTVSMVSIGILKPQAFDIKTLTALGLLLPVVLTGSLLGRYLSSRINSRQFEKLVVIMIIITGIISVLLGFMSLY